MQHRSSLAGEMTALTVVILGSATLGGILATNGRIDASLWWPFTAAVMASLGALLPAALLRSRLFSNPLKHLAATGWRFTVALASLLLMYGWAAEQRKCFLGALLTCYFVALPLESWFQIRQVKSESNR